MGILFIPVLVISGIISFASFLDYCLQIYKLNKKQNIKIHLIILQTITLAITFSVISIFVAMLTVSGKIYIYNLYILNIVIPFFILYFTSKACKAIQVKKAFYIEPSILLAISLLLPVNFLICEIDVLLRVFNLIKHY